MKTVDVFILYSIIRRLSTPFKKWKMYELGVIDEEGNFLVDKAQRTKEQLNSYSYFDILILNLKKMLAKLPGGSTRIASFAAALYLIREGYHVTNDKQVKILVENFDLEDYIQQSYTLFEDEGGGVPANNIGGDQVSKKDNPMNIGKMLKRKHGLVTKDCSCETPN